MQITTLYLTRNVMADRCRRFETGLQRDPKHSGRSGYQCR